MPAPGDPDWERALINRLAIEHLREQRRSKRWGVIFKLLILLYLIGLLAASLSQGLWKELGDQGIDVLASCAGAVRTPGYERSMENRKEAPGTLDPAEVAERTLEALGDGPVTVPGTFNKIANFIMGRLLPRKTAISIMHKNTQNLQ